MGIGNSAPDKTLVVQGSGAEAVIADTGTIPTLRFREGGVTKGVVRTSSADMQFYTGGSSASNLALTIDSSQDSVFGGNVASDGFQIDSFRIIQKDFGSLSSGSQHLIGTANANFAGTIKMWTNHNSGSGYVEYSLVYSTNAKQLSLVHKNQPYTPSAVQLTLGTSNGQIKTNTLSYNTGVKIVVESMNTQFTFA
jgi:hypothetical protein